MDFFEFFPLNLLLVQSHQAEIFIVKHLIQGRNNVTRCGLKPDHSIRVVVKTTPLPSRPRCRLVVPTNEQRVTRKPNNNSKITYTPEVESRTQGSKPRPRTQNIPRPRPRTALPRTDPLEAKDKNARGQGQGPRTQAQVFLKKIFLGDLQKEKKDLQKNFCWFQSYVARAFMFKPMTMI